MNILLGFLFFTGAAVSNAGVLVQCPNDSADDAISGDPNVQCMHLTSGDGFATMADGKSQYIFGFADVTGVKTASQGQKDRLIRRVSSPPSGRLQPSSYRKMRNFILA